MTDKQAAEQLAEEISRILREPFEINGGPA